MSENNMQSCLIYLYVKQLMIEQQLKITNFLLCEGKSRREKKRYNQWFEIISLMNRLSLERNKEKVGYVLLWNLMKC